VHRLKLIRPFYLEKLHRPVETVTTITIAAGRLRCAGAPPRSKEANRHKDSEGDKILSRQKE